MWCPPLNTKPELKIFPSLFILPVPGIASVAVDAGSLKLNPVGGVVVSFTSGDGSLATGIVATVSRAGEGVEAAGVNTSEATVSEASTRGLLSPLGGALPASGASLVGSITPVVGKCNQS